jgi:hypothetical protein
MLRKFVKEKNGNEMHSSGKNKLARQKEGLLRRTPQGGGQGSERARTRIMHTKDGRGNERDQLETGATDRFAHLI